VNVDLNPLNDEQRLIVLTKKAQERGLTLSEDVGNYIITHFSRDLHALVKLLEQLDHDSLAEQRQLTIPFVKPRLSL
jgi:DnaA family protein